MSRRPSVPGTSTDGGIHPTQDVDDHEERARLCLDVAAAPPVAVCTTPLADTEREVAAARCRYLFGTVITELRGRDGAAPGSARSATRPRRRRRRRRVRGRPVA